MSSLLKQECNSRSSIVREIEEHPAWHGRVSGLEAEKMMRGRKIPYLYILRAGEYETDYYVTFLLPDLSIKHQPFIITDTAEGWYFENTGGGGPFTTASIDDVLHLIMHCGKQAPVAKVSKD